ncbi:hypothetical protein UPYG_G00030560 [Umbra pygmaea]|uniref:Protein transport protein sec16 n=1 Tax=Umbra pygmaea TaxID=75934 RepID=A0ABD0XMN5_UMBPY
MDPGGRPWLSSPDPGWYPQRPRKREDHHTPPHSYRGHGSGHYPQPQPPPHWGNSTGHYLPPPPEPMERQWSQVGSRPHPRNMAYLTSPLPLRPPPEFSLSSYSTPPSRKPYDTPLSVTGYSRPERQPSTLDSRQAYEYPAQGYWDYGQDYSFYDHSYYGGVYGHGDAGQWAPQDQWRSAQYQDEMGQQQDCSGRGFFEPQSYDQPSLSSQHDFRGSVEENYREIGEVGTEGSGNALGTLASSKASGLSSSSYELSQYINGAEQTDPGPQPPWSTADTEHATVSQAIAPLKYNLPHSLVSFGPAGQLIWVSPGPAMQGNPAKVEIHSLEIILGETQAQQAMRQFPGPLAREDLHKVDAISFAHQRAEACMKDQTIKDSGSATLLWNLLVLLCRQNGRIVGSDIAELLMRDSHVGSGNEGSKTTTLIDLSEGPSPETDSFDGADLLTGTSASLVTADSTEKDMQKYTKLLLAGRKKEALELAMKTGLWGHALFLSSKMDNRSYTTVLSRFTGQLCPSDPLQTLFQLLSGKIPAVTTSYGSDQWGDWKPHLTIILSNETGDSVTHKKSIITMGDTLASRGLLHAAHICYLTACVPFGPYTAKGERLVLLGRSNSVPFKEFADNSAIRCTELFEYSQRLGDKFFSIPSFQVYKFLYACRLLDVGLASQAYHYFEVIGGSLLQQQWPCMVLLGELIKLAERLKLSEGIGQLRDTADSMPGPDPDWLHQLRLRQQGIQMVSSGCSESQTHGSAVAHGEGRVNSESDTADLSGGADFQGSEAESVYHNLAEEQQQQHVQAQQIDALPPLPVRAAYTQPAVPLVAGDRDYSYQYTDTGQTLHQTSPQHPTVDCPPLDRQGLDCSSEAGMAGDLNAGMMLLTEDGQGTRSGGQQAGQHRGHLPTNRQEGKAFEQEEIQPKQNTKSGWFSGWFKPKHKPEQIDASPDVDSADPVPATETPPTQFYSPPLPAINIHTDHFTTQPPSAGFNTFSWKAGQQLG